MDNLDELGVLPILDCENFDGERTKSEEIFRGEFYKDRQKNAKGLAEWYRTIVFTDKDLVELISQRSEIKKKLEQAEKNENQEDITPLKNDIQKVENEFEELLSSRYGISAEGLSGKVKCDKCSDTGYLSNGRPCDCWEDAYRWYCRGQKSTAAHKKLEQILEILQK